MLFSIPETTQVAEDNGSKFWMFHVHVNGVLHCQVRYRQFAEFNEKLKREFGDQVPSKSFPGKKLFGLNLDQLEERRQMLENYIQLLTQDGEISTSDVFNDFFLAMQKATRKAVPEDVELDIYLMNGNKFTISVLSTDETDEVLETAMRRLGLSNRLYHYFGLFLMRHNGDEKSESIVVRMLQDFESPYLSLKSTKEPHRIVIRKSYWSSVYDDDILNDRIACNLLYVQVVDDIDRGWITLSDKERRRLGSLRESGSKKEFLKLARGLKFYGFIQFKACKCDYPKENSKAIFAIGERELNMRVVTDENTVKEGKFMVAKIRCWRLCAMETIKDSEKPQSQKFSFEYLFNKDKLQWITVESDQGIMISMCLQGIVDEIIREKEGKPIRMPKLRRQSDASSTSSQASSRSSAKTMSPVPVLNEFQDVVSSEAGATAAPKSITTKVQEILGKKTKTKNEVFDDFIGDDDL